MNFDEDLLPPEDGARREFRMKVNRRRSKAMNNISSSVVAAVICGFLSAGVVARPIHAETSREQTQQGVQPKQLQEVQARQLSLKAQMDLIRKTNDLGERQRLLDEHLKTMMMQVQEMSKISGSTTAAAARETLLEERTELITSLMDQMISHYEMQATCSAK
jgi:hypothetical protein